MPYGCTSARFIKRSRSDAGEVFMRPMLRTLLGLRYRLIPQHSHALGNFG